MTSWERFKRMYEHREADRIPIIDEPWSGTLRRWRREGMPEGMDWCDYFDVDKLGIINIDISPRMPEITLEETDRYYIRTSPWGVTMKHFKEEDSTPEFLDFTITTQEAWDQAKKQMTLEDDRIPWEMLRQNYDKWRAEGRWISGKRRVYVAEASILDSDGEEVGRGTGTFMRSQIPLSSLPGYHG